MTMLYASVLTQHVATLGVHYMRDMLLPRKRAL